MSNPTDLAARVEALEKAVQSLLGAVNLLEQLFEKSGLVDGSGGGGVEQGQGAEKAADAAKKKHAPVKKRVSKK